MRDKFLWAFMIISSITFGQKPIVVGTASMFADMAKNIAGDYFEVHTIVPIGYDPHTYEPTPNDAKLLFKAQIILKNELTFEGWLTELIANSGTKAKLVTLTQGIEPIKSKAFHNATDPHAWMTAKNGVIYCENIKKALIEFDPIHKETYQNNFEKYKLKLIAIDSKIKAEIQRIPEQQRVLITSHDAFQYFGRHYGLHLESVLGTSTEADIMVSDILRLNKVIQENKVKAVFIESTINPKILNQIATDNNVAIGGNLFADSLGDSLSEASTYEKMLLHNGSTILSSLTNNNLNKAMTSQNGYIPFLGILVLAFITWILLSKRIFKKPNYE